MTHHAARRQSREDCSATVTAPVARGGPQLTTMFGGGGGSDGGIGAAIERATSETLLGPDVAAEMAITDALKDARADADAMGKTLKPLRKRLGSKNPKVLMLSLSVSVCGTQWCMSVAAKWH